MVKKLLIGCFAACAAACATTHSTSEMAPRARASTGPPAGCVADTATRIPVSPHECAGFGKVWTNQDTKQTGATDPAQALQLLDPRVTTH